MAGCDSVITLDLTINNSVTSTDVQSACGSFTWIDGVTYTSRTNAPTWTIAGGSVAGCDSVITLDLTINNSVSSTDVQTTCGSFTWIDGVTYTSSTNTPTWTIAGGSVAGCDSVITLDLTINTSVSSSYSENICEGQVYTLPDGSTVSGAGTYEVTLTSAAGCDSLVSINLSLLSSSNETITAGICEGESYNLNGSNYTTAGTYTQTIQNQAGCDSTITLILQINPAPENTINISICEGSSYNFYGTSYSQAGQYQTLVPAASGCDSLITLNLNLISSGEAEINAAICEGNSYNFGGTNYTSAGTYTLTLISAAGCDSVVTLNLTVNQATSSTTTASICEGSVYTFNGNTYNSSGTYTANLSNANGCDSTATLILTVTESIETTQSANICQGASYTLPDGSVVNSSGTYTSILVSAGGCDSVVTTNLNVQPFITASQTVAICEGGSVKLPDGSEASAAGDYSTERLLSAGGCDSVITTTVIVNPQQFTNLSYTICENDSVLMPDGTYQNLEGSYSFQLVSVNLCDSIVNVQIHTDELPAMQIPADTSVCPGTELSLSASGALSYQWTYSDGTNIGGGANQQIAVNSESQIIITGYAGECTVYDTMQVSMLSMPQIIVNPATPSICQGDSILLNLSGSDSFVISGEGYIACDTCSSTIVSADSSTIFTVTATLGVCSVTSTVPLQVIPLPDAQILGETVICEGETITLIASGGNSYLWSTGDSTATVELTPEMSLDVFVTALAGNCSDTAQVGLTVNPLPFIDVGEDTTIQVGGSVQLEAVSLLTPFWNPTEFLSCTDCHDPVAMPLVPTTYCATVINSFGCVASDCITISIDTLCNELFIPNVFSPAAGGHENNDCFRVYGAECIVEMSLTVYDRWGEKVFETTNKNDCWDGTFRGRDQNTGVFIYYLSARTIEGETINRQGNVTLLR
ncbi:MAG: gliding motility-associated C-terminal domain-containing protein [Bacteroidia bacterium]